MELDADGNPIVCRDGTPEGQYGALLHYAGRCPDGWLPNFEPTSEDIRRALAIADEAASVRGKAVIVDEHGSSIIEVNRDSVDDPECVPWCNGEHDQLAEGRCHTDWVGIDADNARLLFRAVLPAPDVREDLGPDERGVIQITALNPQESTTETIMTLTYDQEEALTNTVDRLR